jgi:hypothetical protein
MTEKQKAARQHNGLMGHCAMISRNSISIMTSPTVTEEGRDLAYKINQLSHQLNIELRAKRIDPS